MTRRTCACCETLHLTAEIEPPPARCPCCGASLRAGRPRLTLGERIVDESTVLIEVTGELDMSTLAQLAEAVDTAFLAGSESLVLDLTRVAAARPPILYELACALPSVGAATRRLAVVWPQATPTALRPRGSGALDMAVHRTLAEGRSWLASATPERARVRVA